MGIFIGKGEEIGHLREVGALVCIERKAKKSAGDFIVLEGEI